MKISLRGAPELMDVEPGDTVTIEARVRRDVNGRIVAHVGNYRHNGIGPDIDHYVENLNIVSVEKRKFKIGDMVRRLYDDKQYEVVGEHGGFLWCRKYASLRYETLSPNEVAWW